MHMNEMFYALICINKHENTSISCMLSVAGKRSTPRVPKAAARFLPPLDHHHCHHQVAFLEHCLHQKLLMALVNAGI